MVEALQPFRVAREAAEIVGARAAEHGEKPGRIDGDGGDVLRAAAASGDHEKRHRADQPGDDGEHVDGAVDADLPAMEAPPDRRSR